MPRAPFPSRHKYRAKPQELDGIRFDSKKEAKRYTELKLAQRAGKVVFFLRQVPFDLPGNVKYRIDFQVFWAPEPPSDVGDITWEDVKGMRTKQYIMKKKQVEALYPIKITEI